MKRCRKGRLYILDEIMLKPVIAEPRAELSKYAPKMLTIKIDVDKIKRRHRQGRQGHSGDSAPNCNCKIDVEEDGSVFISAINVEDARARPAYHQDHRGRTRRSAPSTRAA